MNSTVNHLFTIRGGFKKKLWMNGLLLSSTGCLLDDSQQVWVMDSPFQLLLQLRCDLHEYVRWGNKGGKIPFLGKKCYSKITLERACVKDAIYSQIISFSEKLKFIALLHSAQRTSRRNNQSKSEFSLKLPSYITFCRPGVTDDCTNQFLVKIWPIFW